MARAAPMNRGAAWRQPPVIVAALSALALAMFGAWVTDLGPWYFSLHEPPWKPADFWFGPAWTLIFTLTATAGVIAWRQAPTARRRLGLLAAFALNGFLNALWSVLFFRLQRPDWALAEVGLLWASIVLLIVLAFGLSRQAALLLVPYLAWVTFASMLNLAVVRLNVPFGGA